MAKLHDLLTGPLFAVGTPGMRLQLSLPEVLARLAEPKNDAGTGFLALQPHQEHPFHSFLVLLAAQVLHEQHQSTPPIEAEFWLRGLLALTRGKDEPWHLVVDDLEQPAFLQAPPKEKSLAKWKELGTEPDAIDILVTAKNHDVKQHRVQQPRPEHWIYALISLQTMNGFLGAGNYGIARMNGGFGNRPGIAIDTSLSAGGRFRKHLEDILPNEKRDQLSKVYGFRPEGGVRLVWLEPWDGTSSLPLNQLDPHFIEICRRFRFVVRDDRLVAFASSSSASRIQVELGRTGDPWTPVDKTKGTALTLSGDGFTYPKVCELLFSEKYEAPQTAEHRQQSSALYWNGVALVRGQGKTEGFHHRIVPIPSEAAFDDPSWRATYQQASADRVEVAGTMKHKVLKTPLLMLTQGEVEPQKLDYKNASADPWLDAYEKRVNECFFGDFFRDVKQVNTTEGRVAWIKRVHRIAEEVLMQAMREAPVSSARRFKLEALALSIFRGSSFKHFPALHPVSEARVTP